MQRQTTCYDSLRGGHAPGHLRDALLKAIDDLGKWEIGQPAPLVEIGHRAVPILVVCGLLWNCTDVLPEAACHAILDFLPEDIADEVPTSAGWTYARGVRLLKSCFTPTVDS